MAKKSFGRRFVEALKKIWKDEEEDIKKQGVEIAITAAEIAIPQIPDAYNKTRAWFEERKRKREEESKKDQRVEEEKKVESEESKTETETPDPRLSYLGCPPPILGERSRFEVGSTSGYNPDDSEPPLVLCQALPNTLVAIFFWLLGLWFLILFHFRHSHALAIPEQSYMSSLRNSCPVLSAEPPIYPRVLQPCDQFLIFACGGLLEHLSNPEEVQIVHDCPRADEAIAPTGLRLEMQLGTVFHMQGMASREYLDDLHAEAQDDFVISLTEQGVPGSYNEDAALIAYPGCETFPCDGFEASFKVLDQYESTLSKLGLVRVSTDDTAGAAQMVASQRAGGKGAVASVCAAAIYGLDILEERIQDDDDNITRYIMLAREPNIPRTNRPHKVEELLKEFDNVCTLRVRMRISNNLCNPRNFVTTISRCNKVVNIPNSMTILDELGEVSVVSKAFENYQDGRRFRYMQHATPEKNKRAER